MWSLWCLPLLLTPPAGDLEAALHRAVARVLPQVVADRRAIHAHPELGEREVRTAALVAQRLRALGLEVREKVAGTGVVAVLQGGRPGGVAAYRADMDALPITEKTGLPFAAKRKDLWGGKEVGVMHACGHDVHVAVALGVAAVLADPAVRPHLRGTVVFLFQPAEEGLPREGLYGARRMIAEGALRDPAPSAVFGLHVTPTLRTGQVGICPGPALAAVDRFEIRVRGRQTHGAYPHRGVDTVLVASHIVVALQAIAARFVDTREAVVVTVGKIEAGNRFNIIPETALLVGTIRTHKEEVQRRVHRLLRRIAGEVAAAFGARAEVSLRTTTPATVNDPDLVARLRPVFAAAVGAANVVEQRPEMGGEDFAYYARLVPGCYYWLGVGNKAKGCVHSVHTPYFKADEDAIPVGIRTSALLCLRYLEGLAAAKDKGRR